MDPLIQFDWLQCSVLVCNMYPHMSNRKILRSQAHSDAEGFAMVHGALFWWDML